MVPEPSVDWQMQCSELKHRGSYLLQLGLWSDCIFLVGTKPDQDVISGHKLILAMASPVFEAMFYGGMAETNKHIPILDVRPEVFKALLEYIYTDNVNIKSVEIASALYYAAKKYLLPHLVKKCTRYLWSALSPKNACYIFELASMFESRVLLDKCIQIFKTNTCEVLKTSGFEEADVSTVSALFSLEMLNIDSELQLLEAAERHTFAQPRSAPGTGSELTIRNAVEKIRFLTLSSQQIAEGPASSPLLTRDEVLALFGNVASGSFHLPLPPGLSACRVPRKRPHTERQENLTIVDCLNEECWRAVLDHVPIRDVFRSESVSRQWQKIVHAYCSNVGIGIKHNDPVSTSMETLRNVRWLTLWEANRPSFERWADKHGEAVVAAYCATGQRLKTIRQHCPYIEAIMFIGLPDRLLLVKPETFKRLERICFKTCNVSDHCVDQFLGNNDVKRLEIYNNEQVTGQCLTNTNMKNLKSLGLGSCKSLDFCHMASAFVHLRGLVELELFWVSEEIVKNIHSVLGNMTNLVVLLIKCEFVMKCLKFYGAVCKLKRLKYLKTSLVTTDEDLKAVTRCCKELQVLWLESCEGVTGLGVSAACEHVGARLTEFAVEDSELRNDDVVACIQACPKLTSLNVRGCPGLTAALLPRAAAARRGLRAPSKLRLYVAFTNLCEKLEIAEKMCEDQLILDKTYSHGYPYIKDEWELRV